MIAGGKLAIIIINMPNGYKYCLTDAVFDFNGTLAEDGIISCEVKNLLRELSTQINIKVITADTFGLAREQLKDLPKVNLHIINAGEEALQKAQYVIECGKNNTICFGNGANDKKMFHQAILSVAVIGSEGAYYETIAAATIVVTRPIDAINLLLNPRRIVATLRK